MIIKVSNKTLTSKRLGGYYYLKNKKYMIIKIDYYAGKLGLTFIGKLNEKNKGR